MRAGGGRRESRSNRAGTCHLFREHTPQTYWSFAEAAAFNFIRRHIGARGELRRNPIATDRAARREDDSREFSMESFASTFVGTARVCTHADFASSAKRGERGGAQLGSRKRTTKSP